MKLKGLIEDRGNIRRKLEKLTAPILDEGNVWTDADETEFRRLNEELEAVEDIADLAADTLRPVVRESAHIVAEKAGVSEEAVEVALPTVSILAIGGAAAALCLLTPLARRDRRARIERAMSSMAGRRGGRGYSRRSDEGMARGRLLADDGDGGGRGGDLLTYQDPDRPLV